MRRVAFVVNDLVVSIRDVFGGDDVVKLRVDDIDITPEAFPPPLLIEEPEPIGFQVKGYRQGVHSPGEFTKIGNNEWVAKITGRSVEITQWDHIAVTEVVTPIPESEPDLEGEPEPSGTGAIVLDHKTGKHFISRWDLETKDDVPYGRRWYSRSIGYRSYDQLVSPELVTSGVILND